MMILSSLPKDVVSRGNRGYSTRMLWIVEMAVVLRFVTEVI